MPENPAPKKPPISDGSAEEAPPPARWRAWGIVLFSGFLPGALAGTQIAGLLFFLNPHLPFDPLPVARGIGLGGCLLGAVSLLVLLPFSRGRPGSSLRQLPIHLILVLTAAGISAWVHASYFAFFLPPGINRRLLKAAILLSLAALICFYTVLLHRLRQRRYGIRSWGLFALMALASIYVVVERREAFRPPLDASPRPTTFQGPTRPLLCVIGVESATLDAILPLAEQGQLPFFSKMLREGAPYRLTPLQPARRSPLWATLATGKYPYRHGVVGERSFNAGYLVDGARLTLLPLGFDTWASRRFGRPIDADALQVRTLWEILSRLGVRIGLVGWPLTWPPPEGIETTLPDRFFDEDDGEDERFEERGSRPESVFPVDLAERARLFRTRTEELDPASTSRFGAEPPAAVLEALARDLWIRDLGFFLLEQSPQIDAFFLRLPGLDEVSRSYFGGYHATQFKGVQDPESARAAQLVSAYYMHLDEVLAQFWSLPREPRWLVFVSPQGTEGAQGWRELWRRTSRRPALKGFTDEGADGVLLLLGDGFRKGPPIGTAKLVDLVPTVLYGLGFPIARDLDGGVLTTAFESPFLARQPLTFVPSYETLARTQ